MKAASNQACGNRQLDDDGLKLMDMTEWANKSQILRLGCKDNTPHDVWIRHTFIDELRDVLDSLLTWLGVRLARRRRARSLLTQRQESTKQLLQTFPQRRCARLELCDQLSATTLIEDAETHTGARQHDAISVRAEATKRCTFDGFRDMTEGPEQRVRGSEDVEAEAMVFTGEVTHWESPNLADGDRNAKAFVS